MRTIRQVLGAKHVRRQAKSRPFHCFAPLVALEQRILLSASGTLTPLVDFNGTNGAAPVAVVEDSSQNLFALTSETVSNGTQFGSGNIVEIPNGSSSINVLAQLSNAGGIVSGESMIIDSSGNLFGTFEQFENDGVSGGIFELPSGSSTIQTLATFPSTTGTLGQLPGSGVVTSIDQAGDLFGYEDLTGDPFAVAAGSGTISLLNSGGDLGVHDLRLGPDGNLYGIQYGPNTDSNGNTIDSVFEIPTGSGSMQTLAALDPSTTGTKATGITFDANNDIFGFSQNGGANGSGAVWELPAGGSTISVVATLDSTTGENPISKPVFGTSGNLYGLTENGGGNGFGTFFDIPAASIGTTVSTDLAASIQPADASSGASDLADLTNNQVVGPDAAGVADDTLGQAMDAIAGKVITKVFGKGFGEINPPSPGGLGEIDSYNPSSPTSPPSPPPLQSIPLTSDINRLKQGLKDLKNLQKDADNDIKRLKDELRNQQQTLDQIKAFEDRVNKMIQSEQSDSAKLNQSLSLSTQFDNEENTINGLETKLAADQGEPAATLIQKQINAAEATEAKRAATINADYNSVAADETNITNELTSISNTLASIPVTITLSGVINSVTASVRPGARETASITVTNSGTAVASGALQIALWARPAGGGADIPLPTVTTRVNVIGGRTQHLRISVQIPATLAPGSYLLVAQLDPNNVFNETAAPGLVVSASQFSVS